MTCRCCLWLPCHRCLGSMAEYASGGGSEFTSRIPCAVCGRKFAPDRIAKHQVCACVCAMGPGGAIGTHLPLDARAGRMGEVCAPRHLR